jgi:hypothetical protein
VHNLLAQQISDEIVLLQRAEAQAKRLLQTARAQHVSFGLEYNYVDEDIARVIGRLRYMQRLAEHQDEQYQADE